MTCPSEAATREVYIDPKLEAAGWPVSDPARVGLEIPVDGNTEAWRALQAQLGREGVLTDVAFPESISDHVLYRENGEVLVVERLAEAQTRFYVDEIAKRQTVRPYDERHQNPLLRCGGSA